MDSKPQFLDSWVTPRFTQPAGHTALNAANLMFEILCVAAEARAARPDR